MLVFAPFWARQLAELAEQDPFNCPFSSLGEEPVAVGAPGWTGFRF